MSVVSVARTNLAIVLQAVAQLHWEHNPLNFRPFAEKWLKFTIVQQVVGQLPKRIHLCP